MINPPFLYKKPHSNQRRKETSCRDELIISLIVVNNSIYPFFKNGVRDQAAKMAFENKNYPDHINGYVICLHYHLQGNCFKRESYPYIASHYYLEGKKFCYIINWARNILNPNSKDRDKENPNKQKPAIKPE